MQNTQKIQEISFLSSNSFRAKDNGVRFYQEGFKRLFDLVLAIVLLPITLPLMFVLWLLIKVESRGPGIYRSERIGLDGKKFSCLKFRTMCRNAQEKLDTLLESDPHLRLEWQSDQKLRKDPRVTRVGRVIRAFSLDELPQLFNVLNGDMSFVGPRPIVKEEIEKYGENFIHYKRVRPGITGVWQVNGRNDTAYGERVNMDTKYSYTANFIMDLKILLRTIPVALSKKGAY